MTTTRCKICDSNNEEGINLLGIHICKECMEDITNVKIDDIRYNYYKSVIRKVWIDYIIEASC